MHIYDILDIKELEMEYSIFAKMKLIWYDPRITFRNLKENKDVNRLGTKDIEKIWSPKLLFIDSDQVGIIRAADGIKFLQIFQNIHQEELSGLLGMVNLNPIHLMN